MKIHVKVKSYCHVLFLSYILLCFKENDGLPTPYKRKLIFQGGTYDWDDSVNFCLEKGGYLVNIHNRAVREAIYYYGETTHGKAVSDWDDNVWGNEIWTGLFVDIITGSELIMRMQGLCQIYDYLNLYNPWDSTTPLPSNADSEKKCTVLKSGDLTWILEKCSQEYSFMCEIYMGECTFEVESGSKCAQSYEVSLVQITADLNACYTYCKGLTSGTSECWAVSFDNDNHQCYPSMSSNPYNFESTTTSCNPMTNPVVSHKRCFEAEVNSEAVNSINNPNPYEPLPVCTFTTPATSTPAPSTSRIMTTVASTKDTTQSTADSTIHNDEIMTTIASTTDTTQSTVDPTTHNKEIMTSADTTYVETRQMTSEATGFKTTTNEQSATTQSITTKLTTDIGCMCNCKYIYNETIDELIDDIIFGLKIDAKNTSSAKRTLISVRDMKTTNNIIGSVMSFLLFGFLSLFLFSDVIRVLTWFKVIFIAVVKD